MSTNTEIPKHWPPEVLNLYRPVRVLGVGGYGSVVLGQRTDNPKEELYAIKVISGTSTSRQKRAYAEREIDILQELAHPNIVQLHHHWTSKNGGVTMALSYEAGPTLESLLHKHGCLSLRMTRVVTAQLVDAVTYLHNRAVVHRDVKPDNIMVVGQIDEEVYKDEKTSGKEDSPSGKNDSIDWASYRKKWKITLIDFGLARALTPKDLKNQPPFFGKNKVPDNVFDSTTSLEQSLGRSNGSSSNQRVPVRVSLSRHFSRNLSSVGNRNYAAPEIIAGVHEHRSSITGSRGSQESIDVTRTLADHVSFYGLLADAYSVGATLRYMMTGVPPDEDVGTVIALERSPLVWLCRHILCRNGGKHFRRISEIPKEACRLIHGLTQPNPKLRTSVRTARLYPWVDDVLEQCDAISKEIQFLKFTLESSTECMASSGEDSKDAFADDVDLLVDTGTVADIE